MNINTSCVWGCFNAHCSSKFWPALILQGKAQLLYASSGFYHLILFFFFSNGLASLKFHVDFKQINLRSMLECTWGQLNTYGDVRLEEERQKTALWLRVNNFVCFFGGPLNWCVHPRISLHIVKVNQHFIFFCSNISDFSFSFNKFNYTSFST